MILEDDLGESKNLEKWEEKLSNYLETIKDDPEDLETFEQTFQTYVNRKEMSMAWDVVSGILGVAGNFSF